MKTRTTTLENLLSMANSIKLYGLDTPIMIDFLLGVINEITYQEIEEYALTFLTEESRAEGYTEADYEAAITNLTELLKPILKEGK